VHAVPDVHATAVSSLSVEPVGFGVLFTVHLVPFHRSTSVRDGPDEGAYRPTAVQLVADEHATPSSLLATAPVGFGVLFTVHLVPFHRSASERPE
jgi:hypothetical protein